MTIAEAYSILGLDKTADRHALKRAFPRLAKKCHPDRTRRKSVPASRNPLTGADATSAAADPWTA